MGVRERPAPPRGPRSPAGIPERPVSGARDPDDTETSGVDRPPGYPGKGWRRVHGHRRGLVPQDPGDGPDEGVTNRGGESEPEPLLVGPVSHVSPPTPRRDFPPPRRDSSHRCPLVPDATRVGRNSRSELRRGRCEVRTEVPSGSRLHPRFLPSPLGLGGRGSSSPPSPPCVPSTSSLSAFLREVLRPASPGPPGKVSSNPPESPGVKRVGGFPTRFSSPVTGVGRSVDGGARTLSQQRQPGHTGPVGSDPRCRWGFGRTVPSDKEGVTGPLDGGRGTDGDSGGRLLEDRTTPNLQPRFPDPIPR